jgi:hypothetical protein
MAIKNRHRAFGILALALVLVLGIARYLFGPGEAPPGQPRLVTLTSESLQALRADFNRDVSLPRVIVLLAPT